jgi:hypothetical protein
MYKAFRFRASSFFRTERQSKLGRRFDQCLGNFDNPPPLAGFGLIPDGPDAFWVSRIPHEQRSRLGLKDIGNGFQERLAIRLESPFDPGEARVRNPDVICDLL